MATAIFTHNETVALMNEDAALALYKIADLIEKYEMGYKEVVEFLREIADNKNAQAMVCKLRDEINNG